MAQLFTNNAASELAGAIASGATSLTLTTGHGARFPNPTGGDFFLATLYQIVGANEVNHEIVRCTARTGDVLTVERAQEGTTARAFANADPVELRATAGTLASKADVVDAYTHPANHPASIITQDASNRFVTDAEKTTWNSKQDSDADISAIAALAGTTGVLTKTATNTWALDVEPYAKVTAAQTLTNKTFTGYTETVYNLAGTVIDAANGTIQTKTLSANTTLTESMADGQSVILGITASTFSVTWPSTVWSKVGGSGTAPTLTSTGVNWIVLWQTGGTLRGAFLGTT